MTTATGPRICIIQEGTTRVVYRVSGGCDLSNGFAARPGVIPWCEVTVYDNDMVGGFGGEVWPAAWPALFSNVTAAYGHCVGHRITDAFRQMAANAPVLKTAADVTAFERGPK